jgi:hypothetical protein
MINFEIGVILLESIITLKLLNSNVGSTKIDTDLSPIEIQWFNISDAFVL